MSLRALPSCRTTLACSVELTELADGVAHWGGFCSVRWWTKAVNKERDADEDEKEPNE